MSIVNPLLPANPVIQTAANPVSTTEERQLDLRLEQVVRATVVEGGLDKALLEMNHRHYRAQSDQELQVGQKLTLQVLQTHPALEMRVVRDPFGGRLSQLLPLLTQSYDWSKLLDRLQQQPQSQQHPVETARLYQQLQQLLQPNGRLPANIETRLAKLPIQLQQLFVSLAGNKIDSGQPVFVPQPAQAYVNYQTNNSGQSLPDLTQVLRALQGQLQQLQQANGRPISADWVATTQQLLAPLPQSLAQLPAPAPQLSNLFALLGQMRQQPSLPPQLTAELERLILQLTVQRGSEPAGSSRVANQTAPQAPPQVTSPATPLATPPATPTAVAGQFQPAVQASASTAAQAVTPDSQPVAQAGSRQIPGAETVYRPPAQAAVTPQPNSATVIPAEVSTGLKTLLAEVQHAQGAAGKLSPELLGRLEGLLDKLQQLPQAEKGTLPVMPGLELISQQLVQLVSQGPQRPEGGQLGLLSQLFGFHLEAELLKGKQKEALNNLKASLLALQKELGEEVVKEPLQRLEMFQLCKARLAEEQVQFLPLPFNELEEGYLLMEQAEQNDDEESEPPLQLALSLRLSALGSMQVDMLYDKEGLHLRLACEDKEKMEYLQQHAAELEEAIETVPLQGVSFAADASEPARQLMARLLPEALGMLDARI